MGHQILGYVQLQAGFLEGCHGVDIVVSKGHILDLVSPITDPPGIFAGVFLGVS